VSSPRPLTIPSRFCTNLSQIHTQFTPNLLTIPLIFNKASHTWATHSTPSVTASSASGFGGGCATACSEKGVRLAQNMQAGPCIPVGTQVKRLELAQLLGRHGVFLTCAVSQALSWRSSVSSSWRPTEALMAWPPAVKPSPRHPVYFYR
jgi:hypothetical protein